MIDFDTFKKLPKNVGDLGKLIIAKGFKKVDPWLTEKRVDQKKMTVDRIFFSKNNTFCME